MDPSSWLLYILGALVLSAFSSGMEIAFITSNKLKIELDKKQGVFAARIISHFVRNPKMFIATMLVGNNVALVIYGFYMGEVLMSTFDFMFGDGAKAFGGPWGEVIVQTIISTIIVVIVAEFIPKAIFSKNPNRWLNLFAFPLLVWYALLWVLAWIVTGISNVFLRVFLGTRSQPMVVEFGRVDLDHYVQEATGNPDHRTELDHEIQIFQNALDFSKVKARDCLIPRNELVSVSIDDSIEDLRKKFIETRLSKILVFRESIDHIIGYVHSYELFKRPSTIQSVLRPVAIIPEPMQANEILELFIKKRKNVAVVVDEFGGTAGIITMEDIVEEIFGEIEDEHDKEELIETQISPNEFEFSARLEIDYLNSKYLLNLPANEEEYDTLGGLILYLHEDIPEEGQVLEDGNLVFTVTRVGETKVDQVRILNLSKD